MRANTRSRWFGRPAQVPRINLRAGVLRSSLRSAWALFPVIGLAFNVLTVSRAAEASEARAQSPPATNAPAQSVESKWGIRILGPYLSGGGNLVDFRYQVLDAAKAAPLTKRENKPTLFNPANGARLIVPDTPKLGSLRQTATRPTEGRVYLMLFANTRHRVKHGDKVTITAGECKLENLTVE